MNQRCFSERIERVVSQRCFRRAISRARAAEMKLMGYFPPAQYLSQSTSSSGRIVALLGFLGRETLLLELLFRHPPIIETPCLNEQTVRVPLSVSFVVSRPPIA